MANKIPWTRLDAGEWMNEVSCLSPTEKCIYVMLRFQMLYTGEPLLNDFKALSLYVGYPVKTFMKALDLLLLKKKIISLEDGRLWNLDVEEELNDSNKNLNKFSERASKAAHARWDKQKKLNDSLAISDDENASDDVKHNASDMLKQCLSNAKHDAKHDANAMLVDAINNNNNIYNKKTNTIVLSKKENASEDLATEVSVQSETTDDAVEQQLDHDTPSSENQSPVSQQKSTEKKTKRSRDRQSCRIPDDFEPDYDFAIQEGLPPERVKVEIENFKDYWRSSASPNAVKKDWPAAWRIWVRKAVEDLKKGKNYGKPGVEQTKQQRGWNYRVAQHMSNIKNSDNVFKFLFEDDERTAVPLENRTKTIDCRSEESYLIGP
ncbi:MULTISPECIES: DUF1376 domain-containing protein [Bartonella]|uniref:Uncharacterized protein YdaU (DUF1376 family) n=1 Tax=Bartonella chomelii TaxID=236402 RepID=A0ABR6E4J6_9HYPH|nr:MULTISPECIES: DUF1376 domain-containing protein [Bartonella]MBA9083481.1 uncharacterized protein YdaU (DUF1376 family) [Bartonella chomelii]